MEEQYPRKKFHIGDAPAEEPATLEGPVQEMKRHQVDRLSTRLTLIAILLPCIIGGIVFFVYLDIKKTMSSVQHLETKGRSDLAANVDQRIEDLHIQIRELETSTKAAITDFSSRIAALDEKLQKTGAEVGDLQSRDASLLKDIGWLKVLQKKGVEEMKASVNTVRTDLATWEKKLSAELKTVGSGLKSETEARKSLEKSVEAIPRDVMSTAEIQALLAKEKQFYRISIREAEQRLTREFNTAIQSLKSKGAQNSGTASPEKPETRPPSGTDDSAPSIREQNL